MTIEQAIEQLDWYFEADDGLGADPVTKEAYERLKRPYCTSVIRNSEYKLEKPKVTDEDIEKMSFEEKKWLMIFLIMSMNDDRVGSIFNETWKNEMVKKLYSML